jgi:hypothetical protein
MMRFALILAAIVVFGLVIRNALRAAMKEGKPGPKRRSNPNLPPDTLVCGVCGQSFDPEASGWICPKCKK